MSHTNAPSLLPGYVVPVIYTTMGISDSLIIPTAGRDMVGDPMFMRLPFYARHPILPRVVPRVLFAVPSTRMAGFINLGRLTTTTLCNEASLGSLSLQLT
jgi:hypothetical protein